MARTERFQGHDYYNIDELLSEEHLLARGAVRDWVSSEIMPIIEDYSNNLSKAFQPKKGYSPNFQNYFKNLVLINSCAYGLGYLLPTGSFAKALMIS